MDLITYFKREEQAEFFFNYITEISDEISKLLGNGHTESIYHNALAYELTTRNIAFKRDTSINKNKDFRVTYKGKDLGYVVPDIIILKQHHIDFKLDNPMIIELKRCLNNEHESIRGQLHKYMRSAESITDKEHYAFGATYGILINFTMPKISFNWLPEDCAHGDTSYIPVLNHENLTELWGYESRVHSLSKSELKKYRMDEKMSHVIENAVGEWERIYMEWEDLSKDQSQEDMDEWLRNSEFIETGVRLISKKKKPHLTLVRNIDETMEEDSD